LSAHGGRPQYVFGPTAHRALSMLHQGVGLIGTLHADSVDEAIGSLRDEFGLPAADIARVTLVAISRIMGGEDGRQPRFQSNADIERRVVEIGLLAPAAEGVRVELLTAWEPRERQLELQPGASAALAGWAGVSAGTVQSALRDRAAALSTLLRDCQHTPDTVAATLRRFLEPQPS
jgi:hypothetical protein